MSNVVDRAHRATYHPKGYGVSEGLARARKPFRISNAITGLVITSFAFSVYIYSIRAVKQDDFSDIVGPDIEERKAILSLEEEEADRIRLKAELKAGFAPVSLPVVEPAVETKNSGIWSSLSGAFRSKKET